MAEELERRFMPRRRERCSRRAGRERGLGVVARRMVA